MFMKIKADFQETKLERREAETSRDQLVKEGTQYVDRASKYKNMAENEAQLVWIRIQS